MKAEPPPKRKITTKKRATAADDAAKQLELATQAGLLAVVLNSAFWGVSTYYGPHWKLAKEEALQLSHSLTVAINASFPENYLVKWNEIIEKFAPWFAVAITANAIVAPRIEQTRKLSAQGKASYAGTGMPPGAGVSADAGTVGAQSE